MLKRTFFCSVLFGGAVAVSAGSALAQSTAYDWTGFYAGGAVGYGFFEAKDKPPYGYGGPDPDGVTGTAFAGANYQMGQLLLGVEADITGGNLQASKDWLTPLEINYVGTVRGRLGFAMGEMLFYATGGVAYSRMTARHSDPAADSANEMYVGWTAGAGIDLHASERWFIRAEYLYTDFGTQAFDFTNIGHPHIVSVDGNMVRLGIGFQF